MLEIILIWFLCSWVSINLGRSICNWLGNQLKEQTQFSVWICFWTGLAGISCFVGLLSFGLTFTPFLKAIVWILLLIPSWTNFQWFKETIFISLSKLKKLHPASWLLILLTGGIAMMKAAGVPEIFDEGAYHLPLIRMWEKQGLVLGMANLNGHYGLNSTWHLLSAISNLDFLPFWKTAMGLNGLVVMVLGFFSASRLQRILNQKGKVSDWIVVFLPFLVFRNLISSPSTDIPAIFCTWFIFTIWLENIENEDSPWNIWPVLMLLPFWTVMLKASSAPLLLIPTGIGLLAWKQKSFKNLGWIVLVGGFMLLPWMLQNWFLTGYAIFPVRLTAIGSPIWQVPISSIDKKFYLEQFGAFAPPEHYDWQWFKVWFKAHNKDTQVILMLALSAIVSVLVALIRKPAERVWAKVYLYTVVCCCLITWLLTITEPRYGFGALVFAALFPVGVVVEKLVRFKPVLKYICLLVLGLQALNFGKTLNEFKKGPIGFIQPASRPDVAFRTLKCINFQSFTPTEYISEVPVGKPVFCWDCPFPCVPKEAINDSSSIQSIHIGPYIGFAFRNQLKD